jgi:hypothetical protein
MKWAVSLVQRMDTNEWTRVSIQIGHTNTDTDTDEWPFESIPQV